MWGLQYLDYRIAKIEIRSGDVKLKLNNLRNNTRNRINSYNRNQNDPGSIGTRISYLTDYRYTDESVYYEQVPRFASLSNKTTDASYNPSKFTNKALNRAGRREIQRKGAKTTQGRTSGAKGASIATLVVDGLNMSLTYAGNRQITKDMSQADKEFINGFLPAANDVYKALKSDGYIPDEYRNPYHLGAIINVVMQGENYTDNQDITSIGIKILEDFSGNYDKNRINEDY